MDSGVCTMDGILLHCTLFIKVLDASLLIPLLVSFWMQVRVYTPKRLFQQLEAAKEEYIRATVGVRKEHRVLLPKLVEAYARDVKLSPERLVDAVQRCLPESLRTAVQRCRLQGARPSKVVEWVPYKQSFRYLLARDLAFPHLN